jgi:Tol biopolymer transport system component
MTTHDDFDRRLTAWLEATAPAREPESLAERVLARTAATRRRPAWAIPERWTPVTSISARLEPVGRTPWRTVALVALLAIALVGGALLIAGSRQPSLPAPFGLAGNGVLLSVERDDILVRDTIDGATRPLIDLDQPVVGPWPALDGTKFSYFVIDPATDQLDTWVANIDGSDRHRIAGPFAAPDAIEWSPQGDAVVIGETPRSGVPTIALAATDGSGVTPLDVGRPAAWPQWRAPDGEQILFRSENGAETGLFLVARDGTTLRRIELDPGLGPGEVVSDAHFNGATLSPDGRYLAFMSPVRASEPEQGIGLQVHVVTLGAAGQVLEDRTIPHPAGTADHSPSFLPDGKRILFQRNHDDMTSFHVAPIAALEDAEDLGCCSPAVPGRSVEHIVSPDGRTILSWTYGGSSVRAIDIETKAVTFPGIQTDDLVVYQRTAGD